MHDRQADADDNKYFPTEIFRGFGASKMLFSQTAIAEGAQSRTVILSHINLLVIGWMIKKINPSIRLIMFAHGIEIWDKMGRFRRRMLDSCDIIFSVSNFTCEKIKEVHSIAGEKCKVLNNCLDPYLPLPSHPEKSERLLKKYWFEKNDPVLFTLTRLASSERYKGYDKVLEALVEIRKPYPNIRYLLAGSYDADEKKHLDLLIEDFGLSANVAIAGFVPDEELDEHFALADIYVMPSMKEGFGIVFIEAMYYGLPVIAGNKDGSVDALCNGELGVLVDPDDVDSIRDAIENILVNKKAYTPDRELLMERFSYDTYKRKLEELLVR